MSKKATFIGYVIILAVLLGVVWAILSSFLVGSYVLVSENENENTYMAYTFSGNAVTAYVDENDEGVGGFYKRSASKVEIILENPETHQKESIFLKFNQGEDTLSLDEAVYEKSEVRFKEG